MARTLMVAGNWKMHGSQDLCRELVSASAAAADELPDIRCAVFPPAPYLGLARELAGGSALAVGAQDVSAHASGAFTGETAAAMVADLGGTMTLCGHSERRTLHGESSALVAEKVAAAQDAGLLPILCVGETLEEREAGRTEAVVLAQLEAVVERIGAAGLERLIVAYEPVWAIGTGRTASPEQAQEVHARIRSKITSLDATIGSRIGILYGGSVKPSNAAELFAMADIDGGLIGGAALKAEDFTAICRQAAAASGQ